MKHTRRDFIKTSVAVGSAAGFSRFAALPPGVAAAVESPRMETFIEWLQADLETRKRGLQVCLQRIQELEASIHAWVQVQPEMPTADGPLSGIPFGAKDIIETRGMATEYGSPLYKGRLGSADAAIIRAMRSRGAILLGKTVTTASAYRTPGPDAQPAKPRAHSRRQFERFGGGSGRGHGALHHRGTTQRLEDPARHLLRRHRIQAHFRPSAHGGHVAGVQEPGTRSAFSHTRLRTSLALWKALGYSRRAAKNNSPSERRSRSLIANRKWRMPSGSRCRCCAGRASASSRSIFQRCSKNSTKRTTSKCSMKVLDIMRLA